MNQLSIEQTAASTLENESWIGNSPMIELTKHRLQSMSGSALPVLIYGQTGTGKMIAARVLHNHDKGESSPFVSVCCKQGNKQNLLKLIAESWNKAKGGSLFIRNIDILMEEEAAHLKAFLLRADAAEKKQIVRLIASSGLTPVNSGKNKIKHHFIDWLHYHGLTIELPTLENRIEDVESLVLDYQRQDLIALGLHFQSSAWEVLKNYQWPENVKQLKCCLDTLAVQAKSPIITKEILLECFPYMAHNPAEKAGKITIDSPLKSAVHQYARLGNIKTEPTFINTSNGNKRYDSDIEASHVARHPALDKAVVYLYNNFKKPINMDELAGQACISPSHLSYLFKHYLGTSFKQTLLILRIVEAMKLLVENPNRQVTQVCDDVGFSDLSFFIRKFKTTVGLSPGVYRDQYGQVKASPELLEVEEVLARPMLQSHIRH